MSASHHADLVARALASDAEAFDRLVDESYAMAYATAYRLIGDADAASDATQEAFVRAYTSLRTFRGTSSFMTWLYRIVVNVSLDMLRRRSRAPERLVEDADPDRTIAMIDPSQDVQGHVERHERQAAVLRALQRLSHDHRTVLVLFDLNGLAYEEIAEVLGVPLGTVKSRLNRARLALREALRDDMELFREI